MFKGWIKNSFIDYPGVISTILFVGKCNFRCPYCHNGELITNHETMPGLDMNVILRFLEKRRGLIDGVVISGGEATLYPQILPFMETVKRMGFLLKLDTNGYNPGFIEKLLNRDLLDYIAMDVKNTGAKYAVTAGLSVMDISRIEASVKIIKESNKEYEFRTTVTKELHTKKDLREIGKWLKGSRRYVLQQYRASDSQLTEREFTSYTEGELHEFAEILNPYFQKVLVK